MHVDKKSTDRKDRGEWSGLHATCYNPAPLMQVGDRDFMRTQLRNRHRFFMRTQLRNRKRNQTISIFMRTQLRSKKPLFSINIKETTNKSFSNTLLFPLATQSSIITVIFSTQPFPPHAGEHSPDSAIFLFNSRPASSRRETTG